jgi:hypothetical protein
MAEGVRIADLFQFFLTLPKSFVAQPLLIFLLAREVDIAELFIDTRRLIPFCGMTLFGRSPKCALKRQS